MGAGGSAHAAAQVEYTILPPTGDTPKAAPLDRSAGIGDRIKITITPDKALGRAPQVYVLDGWSYPASNWEDWWKDMAPGSAPNSWTFTHTVKRDPAPHSYQSGAYSFTYGSSGRIWFEVRSHPDTPLTMGSPRRPHPGLF